MLSIQLLGDQDIVADGESVLPRLGRRSVELIAYLVVHGSSPQPRQKVASLFWPDSSDAQALTNLRRELHLVRSVLGRNNVLSVDARTLKWSQREADKCDVTSFLALVDDAHEWKEKGDPGQFGRSADEAFARYRGPFMPDFYEDWVLEVRERLQRCCVSLLDEVIRSCEQDDIGSALEAAKRRLELEPLEEVGYQTLMRLQTRAGDRAAAMRTYHRCVSTLDRELGVAPDPATTALYEDMSVGTSTGRRDPASPPSGRSIRPVLVGRDHELDGLTQRWDKAAQGACGLHLVSGEAGVGKSRLLEEFTTGVERSGAAVVWARCIPRDGQNALAPVTQWLTAPAIRSRWERLDPRWRVEVQRLLTPTRAAAHREPHSAMVDAWRRPAFSEGLARALIDPDKPTILVMDDLHWCDVETSTWLPVLLDLARDAPMLVLATARADELDDHPYLVSMIARLRTAGLVSDTTLSSLPTRHTASLASSVLGARLSKEEVEQWQQATGGSPLFVVEIARVGEHAPTDIEFLGQLPRVHSVLERRISQSTAAAQQIAALASCVGRDFSLELLCEASDLSSDEVINAVDELWRRRIFLGRSARTYDFSHDLLRDAAYQRIGEQQRQLLHRRIAQALELIHSDDLKPVAAALADQYGRAGLPTRAVRYHLTAAAEAAAVFANVEAIRHYERSLELLKTMPEGRDRDRLELTVRHAMSAPLNAQFGYASHRLTRELERSAQLADRLDDDRQLLLSLAGLFAVRFVQGDVAESFRIAERSLTLSRRCPDVAGQAHFAYGGAATSLGRHEESLPHFAAAHELSIDQPPSIVGTRPEVHGRAWSAHALWLLGREDEAVQWCDWAIERAEAAGHPYSLAVALAYAAITHQLRGDVQRTGEFAEMTQQICARYRFAYYGEWGVVLEAWCMGGHAGVDQLNRGLQALRTQGALARQPYFLGLLADSLLSMGRQEQASATLDAALSAAADHDDRWWLAELWRLKSLTCEGAQADEMVARALQVADSQGSVALRGRIMGHAAAAND